MAIETRGINEYYYRKKRKGARVVSEYVGGGAIVGVYAALEKELNAAKQYKWEKEHAARQEFEERGKGIYDVECLTWDIVGAALVEQGYHRHKGQWRKRTR